MSLLVGKVNDAFRNSVQSTVFSALNCFRGVFRLGLALLATGTIITWLSVFLYGTFYYSYMPNAPQYIRPVHLQFESDPKVQGANSYLSANVSLIKRGEENIFLRGLPYSIQYDLEMPESPANLAAGMFMVKVLLYSKNGEVLAQSSRATVLRYKSKLLQGILALTSLPRLFLGTYEESQTVRVELIEEFQEDVYKPATQAYIEVQSKFVQVYSTNLRIVAKFTGIRYILYTHPWLSALAGVSINAYFLTLIALLSWWQYMGNPTPQTMFSQLITVGPTDDNFGDSSEYIEDIDYKNSTENSNIYRIPYDNVLTVTIGLFAAVLGAYLCYVCLYPS